MLALLVAGCTAVGGGEAVSPVPTTLGVTTTIATTITEGPLDPGDLVDPEVRLIEVDGVELVVAFVDRPATRARGLMEVEDLGDLDGMLFDLEAERETAFTMRKTLIPLDIVFFAADGTGRTMLTMEPCPAEPCPTYPSQAEVRYALEVPAGSQRLTADSVLDVP